MNMGRPRDTCIGVLKPGTGLSESFAENENCAETGTEVGGQMPCSTDHMLLAAGNEGWR